MRNIKVYFVIILTVLSFSALSQNAYIQVESEPGVSVFLDGAFKGKTTSDLGGLIIENVSPGNHTIKVVKEGFNPQEKTISLSPGQVYPYKVSPFTPTIKITESGSEGGQEISRQVGSLKIQSLPIAISISIPALGVNTNKTRDEWKAEDVPVGRYTATFSWNNKTVNYSMQIKQHQQTHLLVNLVKGEVEDRSHRVSVDPDKVEKGSFTDPRDGRVYKTVKIGSQVWMAENLNYETGNSWCYDNDPANCATYGLLYDWTTAKNACPSGWHLPSDEEWKILEGNVDTQYGVGDPVWDDEGLRGYDAGKHLKSTGGWNNNVNATDAYGFTAMPGGSRHASGSFNNSMGKYCVWWSSTETLSTATAWNHYLSYDGDDVSRYRYRKVSGFSVRCLKDD